MSTWRHHLLLMTSPANYQQFNQKLKDHIFKLKYEVYLNLKNWNFRPYGNGRFFW